MGKAARALVLFAGFFIANGADTANCALNGARAVDDMLDSAVYIMASIVRCDNGDTIRCEVDVASAIESVNAMINVIVKAVDDCGGLAGDPHHKCGLAVGVLTRSMAGLAAASGGIVAKCPNHLNGGKPMDTVGTAMENAGKYGGKRAFKTAGFSPTFGQCVINIKDTVKSLFKGIKRIMTVKENCEDPKSQHCAHNSMKIVAAFTGLAEYISGAIAKCSASSKHQVDALCSQQSIRLFHALANVDRAGTEMGRKCQITEAERLYLDNEDEAPVAAPASNSVTLALAALLPISAVVSFVAGSRLAKVRAAATRDAESLVELTAEQ
jgi:hypothetical protein